MSYIMKMQREYEYQAKRVAILTKKLKNASKGTLSVCDDNGKHRWYYRDEDSPRLRYLSRKERKFAEKLAEKRHDQLELALAENRKEAAAAYLRKINSEREESLMRFQMNPVWFELLKNSGCDNLAEELRQWQNTEYRKNSNHSENLRFKVNADLTVRSKSEVLIAQSLEKYNIPYRYECALELGDAVLYPDFTLRHPQTGKIWYWEHFGLADDRGYIDVVQKKLHCYLVNNIVPTINLITTWETKASPLDPAMVEQNIRCFLEEK